LKAFSLWRFAPLETSFSRGLSDVGLFRFQLSQRNPDVSPRGFLAGQFLFGIGPSPGSLDRHRSKTCRFERATYTGEEFLYLVPFLPFRTTDLFLIRISNYLQKPSAFELPPFPFPLIDGQFLNPSSLSVAVCSVLVSSYSQVSFSFAV